MAALQLQISSRGIPSTIGSLWPTKQSSTTTISSMGEVQSWSSSSCAVGPITMMTMKKNSRSRRRMGSLRPVRSNLETAAGGPVEVVVGTVTAVDKDTFWPIVNAAGDKTVVLDMYTQWCGPCKVMAPKYQELSEKYLDVVFLKLDCNQENRSLAKELGIKVVPTFKILKDGKIVKEVTGAKYDNLVAAIDIVRSS